MFRLKVIAVVVLFMIIICQWEQIKSLERSHDYVTSQLKKEREANQK